MPRKKGKKLKEKKPVEYSDKKTNIQTESIAAENAPIVFSWTTMDFIKKPITEFYFIIAAAGAMAMIGWGVYNGNFIMISTFAMMVIVIILVLNENPKKIKVKISERGIDIGSEHYDFSEFRSFKISHVDKMSVLTLKRRKSFSPFKTIYTEKEPVNDLESFLGIYLEKEE